MFRLFRRLPTKIVNTIAVNQSLNTSRVRKRLAETAQVRPTGSNNRPTKLMYRYEPHFLVFASFPSSISLLTGAFGMIGVFLLPGEVIMIWRDLCCVTDLHAAHVADLPYSTNIPLPGSSLVG